MWPELSRILHVKVHAFQNSFASVFNGIPRPHCLLVGPALFGQSSGIGHDERAPVVASRVTLDPTGEAIVTSRESLVLTVDPIV